MSGIDDLIKIEMEITDRLAQYVEKLFGQYEDKWREELNRRDRAICEHFRKGGNSYNMPEEVLETLRYLEDLALLNDLRQKISERRGG